MALYKYETHLHTKEASACATCNGAEHARLYKEAGYDGIIVTDHFFNGNSNVPKDLPWEERIDLFCKGYENAKEEGDRIGLSVFMGWEANDHGTEFLIYGLDKAWLKSHPDLLSWSIEEQYQKVHAAGGYVVHAHPFRMRDYIKKVRLFPDCIDAVEAINLRNGNDEFDQKAFQYAKENDFPVTAGSDAHSSVIHKGGIAFDHKLLDIFDYIESIKTGSGYQLLGTNKEQGQTGG